MIAVIFELTPAAGQRDSYMDLAAALKDDLTEVDGFISVERFESLTTPGKFVSLSFWRDETAVDAWRSRDGHRDAQRRGRSQIFAGYRLRVATVLRDYGMTDRNQAPADSRAVHDGAD